MKKLIPIIITLIMLTGIGCANLPIKTTMAEVPFFGSFVDLTPDGFHKILKDSKHKVVPTPGTHRWEYTELEDGKIAGHTDLDGFPASCSQFAMIVKKELLAAGYREDQIRYVPCSIYDEKKYDHVTTWLTLDNGDEWVWCPRQNWVMRPWEFPTELTVAGIQAGKIPYIW